MDTTKSAALKKGGDDFLGRRSVLRRDTFATGLSDLEAANVNQKGQCMIIRPLRPRFASDGAWSRVERALCSIAGHQKAVHIKHPRTGELRLL